MDLYSCVVASSALQATAVTIVQFRLRRRDEDDYRLRRHIFDRTGDPSVLTDLPELRRAERGSGLLKTTRLGGWLAQDEHPQGPIVPLR